MPRRGAVWLRFATLVVFAMLTNCTVGPDFQAPPPPDVTRYLRDRETIPGRTVVKGSDIPGRWWELFRSKHLNGLIEDGILRNADLAAAESAVRIALANARVQRAALFPVLTGSFESSRQQVASSTLITNAADNSNVYSLHTPQVSVSFLPDVFGGTRRAIESADAQVDLSAFQREGIYLTLTANIAVAAIQEASLRGQIAATRKLIGIQTELLGILKRQNELGQTALPDVVAQETAVAQARLLLPPLERQLAQQRDLLAFLTGRFPSDEMAATFELGSFRLPRTIPLSLTADLVRQRPDIRAAESSLRAANAQVGVALANRLPQIKLTGNAGSTALALSQLFTPGTGFWMIAGNAAQTLFDAGALENKQRAAEHATVQAAEQYRSTVLGAFQNVADVLRALQADARAVEAALEAERTAARSIELVRSQLERGQVSIPSLLVAQQALLQTSLARVQAEALRLADTVALFQALGGGWWNRPPADAALTVGVVKP